MWVITSRLAHCQRCTSCSRRFCTDDYTQRSTRYKRKIRQASENPTRQQTTLRRTGWLSRNVTSGESKCGQRQLTSRRRSTPSSHPNQFGTSSNLATSITITSSSWRRYTETKKHLYRQTKRATFSRSEQEPSKVTRSSACWLTRFNTHCKTKFNDGKRGWVCTWATTTTTASHTKQHLRWPVFAMQVCNNWLQIRINFNRIESDHKCKSELQNPERKKSVHGITSVWWNRARHQWQRDHQDQEHLQHSAHEHWHVSAQFSFVSQVLVVMIHTLHRIAQGCCACHLIHACDKRFSSTLSPPFPSTSSSSHSSFISCTSSTTLRAAATLCTPPERVGTLLTTPTSSQVMSPTPTTSRRLTSSPAQSPWPLHSSPRKGSSRTWNTMTLHSRICFAKHTEYMSITPSEKACLSVSRRRPCPSERCDLLESEQDDLLDQVVRSYTLQLHRLEFCWTDRQSKFSSSVRRKLRNTNSRLIMTEQMCENYVKLLKLSKKTSTALKLKSFNDEINNLFMNSYCSKIRNYVKVIIKVSMKWKN